MSPKQHEPRTTDLLTSALDTHTGDHIALDEFLEPLGERAFGFLLLVLALPNFIPVPTGIGGVMGALVVLVGLQMLWGLEHPWLPGALRRRRLARTSLVHFIAHIKPVLGRLERLCRPRWESLARRHGHRVTGFLLVLTGIGLALPIPFTNYPYGLLLIVFAVALIERDGIVLSIAWIASVAVAITLVALSHVAVDAMRYLF
ncbi:MAG: exopolysaccharide biosynthesis protein [Rhodanobacteraceae bacterium]